MVENGFLKQVEEPEVSVEQACLDSGGEVVSVLCCQSVEDFPDSCLIGACGCAPDASHEVKACNCSEGKCFDGEVCVLMEEI